MTAKNTLKTTGERTLIVYAHPYDGSFNHAVLEGASRIVFICPIWWSEVPAIVKGFVDKVMKQNWAYHATASGVKGHLTHIQQVLVLTTSTAPTWFLRRFCGNYVSSVFLGAAIKQVGMHGRTWVNFGKVGKASRGQHKKHLKRVARLVVK